MKLVKTGYIIFLHDQLNLDNITINNNHNGTIHVVLLNKKKYLVVAMDRERRTIVWSTTNGESMGCDFFHRLSEIKEHGHYLSCTAYRFKCESDPLPFVIHLADIFTNKSSPKEYNLLTKDSDLLRKYGLTRN